MGTLTREGVMKLTEAEINAAGDDMLKLIDASKQQFISIDMQDGKLAPAPKMRVLLYQREKATFIADDWKRKGVNVEISECDRDSYPPYTAGSSSRYWLEFDLASVKNFEILAGLIEQAGRNTPQIKMAFEAELFEESKAQLKDFLSKKKQSAIADGRRGSSIGTGVRSI